MLPLVVGIPFQVCFTPLIGVLFTFPSRYLFTMVSKEYLGLEDGPPMFRQDYTCPALLKDQYTFYSYGAITHFGLPFQTILILTY